MSLPKTWDDWLRSDRAEKVPKELVRPVMHTEHSRLWQRTRHLAVGRYNQRTRIQDHNQAKCAYSDRVLAHSSCAAGQAY